MTDQKHPTHNDARLTLMSAFHLLACIGVRVELLDDSGELPGDSNQLSFAIDGVRALLSKADEEYDEAAMRADKTARLEELLGPALEAGMGRCMSIVGAMKEIAGDAEMRRDVAATALALQRDLLAIRSCLTAGRDPETVSLPTYTRDEDGFALLDGDRPGVGHEREAFKREAAHELAPMCPAARIRYVEHAKKKPARSARLRRVK